MKNKFIKLGVVMLGLAFWVPGALAAAFGISPPWIVNENLKPGSNFVYVIDLSATEIQKDMVINTSFEGDSEIAKWVSVQNKDNLRMQAGDTKLPISINVRIPTDAALGNYTGDMKLSLAYANGTDELAVLLGGKVHIDLTVIGNDVTEYFVQSVDVKPIYPGQDLELEMNLKNLGNTILRNVATKAVLNEVATGAVVAELEGDQLTMPIYPQTMAVTRLPMGPAGLQPGNYWLNVETFNNGRSVYKNRLYFTVNKSMANNAVGTAVRVGDGNDMVMAKDDMKAAAPAVKTTYGADQHVTTSVEVRAPIAEELIIVIIGILLILTGIVGKFYLTFKKKKR